MKSSDRIVLLIVIAAAVATMTFATPASLPAALLLLFVIPGHSLLRLLRWNHDHPLQYGVAIAASIVLMPVPLSWVWSYSNDRHVIGAVVTAINLILLYAAGRRPEGSFLERASIPSPQVRWLLLALVLFVGICVGGTIWLPQAGDRLIPSPMGDYVKHHAVLLSLERYTLPLRNLFYALERDTPYYYYHYHHLLAAALRKLCGDTLSIPLAFAITSALTAMAFVVSTWRLAREFLGETGERGALLAAACVSIVGGWDIIPTFCRMMAGAGSVIILDSWSSCPWRLHNLMTQFVWCPQHVAAMLAVMLAVIGLRQAPWSRSWIGLGPFLAASLFGSSVHLAMVVFATVALYVLLRLASLRAEAPRLRRGCLGVAAIALAGAALMGLQAWGYAQMSQRIPGGLTTQWPRFEYAFLGRLVSPGVMANFLDAPWILLVDFGLPLLACLLVARTYWVSVWRDEGLRLLLLASLLGVVSVFTVRSNHSPFDYSFRIAVMPAQVLAAITAGALLQAGVVRPWAVRRLRWGVLVGGVILGLPVGLYEAPLMAVRTLLRPAPNLVERGALRFLRDQTPPEAVIQGDPIRRESLGQLTDRQIGVMDCENSHVRVFYPKNMASMQGTQARVEEALRCSSASRANELLRHAKIDYILAGSIERELYGAQPQFDDQTWFECVYRNEGIRVYRVRPGPRTSTGTVLE